MDERRSDAASHYHEPIAHWSIDWFNQRLSSSAAIDISRTSWNERRVSSVSSPIFTRHCSDAPSTSIKSNSTASPAYQLHVSAQHLLYFTWVVALSTNSSMTRAGSRLNSNKVKRSTSVNRSNDMQKYGLIHSVEIHNLSNSNSGRIKELAQDIL